MLPVLSSANHESKRIRRNLSSKKGKGKKIALKSEGSFSQQIESPFQNSTAKSIFDTASATLDINFEDDFSSAQYSIQGQNLVGGVFAAHLHCGKAGVNGPIVVTLNAIPNVTEGLIGQGTIENDLVNPSLFTCGDVVIRTVAALYEVILERLIYFNVHTNIVPSGLVRGQIFPSLN